MAIASELGDNGVRVVTVDYPPVNALPVQGWFDLAEALDEAGRDLETRVVVLRAEGKGFNAGVDIKEMQASEGFDALIGANRGCFAAFRAVYECAVPVIAAVQGFCLGGGLELRDRRSPGCRRRIFGEWRERYIIPVLDARGVTYYNPISPTGKWYNFFALHSR